MLPSNLNVNIGNAARYNKKVLVSNIDIKSGLNIDINKDHEKLPMTPPEPGKAEGTAKKIDKPIKDHLPVQHERIDNRKMLAKKYDNEKLTIAIFIVGAGSIAHHFW